MQEEIGHELINNNIIVLIKMLIWRFDDVEKDHIDEDEGYNNTNNQH